MTIIMVDTNKYFGVYIPNPNESKLEKSNEKKLHVYNTYDEISQILKESRNARFKRFCTKAEAEYFALKGSVSGPGNPNILSESISFKSLKRQDIFQFRRFVETDDYDSVERLIWENPRYLIGIGDTPTIMQEGPRYNALHLAAKHNRAEIVGLILRTVASPTFTKLLYGPADENSYVVRPEVLVDLYLNTPDRSFNETPIHFAAKFGFIEVVKVFVQYPQLQLHVKNRYGQTPKDVTCKSTTFENSSSLTIEIHRLLDELFFVPVWRSNEDDVQPVIGQPFSPKSPPVCPLSLSPLSPTMEIRALAGPMNYEEATNFHKTWKSPKTNRGTPHISKGILLRSPLESEKGIEKVGRSLAKKFRVSWKEYWPFLDKFIDLGSEEGLKLLEKYLHGNIVMNAFAKKLLSPISELCYAFSNISINKPKNISEKEEHEIVSPYLFIENICVVFAKNVLDIFLENYDRNMPVENNIIAILKIIRNLMRTINSCKIENIFKCFAFNKIHSRIGFWITRNLCKINDYRLKYATCTFRMIHATDKNEIIRCILLSPSSHVELESIVETLKCINDKVIKLLHTEIVPVDSPKNELSCTEEWSLMEVCYCYNNNDNILLNYERSFQISPFNIFSKTSTAKKKIIFPVEDFDEEQKVTCNTNGCDNFTELSINDICDNDIINSDKLSQSDEIFSTPPNSVAVSDNEISSEDEIMSTPDESPDIFIYDNKGTSMDNAVLEAIGDVDIGPLEYPCIYRWKHSILLYSNFKRSKWPSPDLKSKNEFFCIR